MKQSVAGYKTMAMKTFSTQLSEWVELNVLNCIGVDECMKVCPAVDPGLSIKELNEATRDGGVLTEATLKFAADCVQCGRCDSVCPTVAGRSVMMLKLKEKMAESGLSPESHKKYFALKGHDKSRIRQAGFNAFMKARWKFGGGEKLKSEKLAPHIDKERFKKAEYLFYFGCYIFTKERSAVQCVDMADRLGMDYEVLGGLISCCGWPSLMAGRTEESEDCHKHLAGLIDRSSPRFVITGCAECFMSLNKVRVKYDMAFEPLTTPMWLNRFADRLDLKKDDSAVTFHDSCHISRKSGMPEPARELLSRLNPVTEMKRSGPDDTFCCGYWGLHSNPANLKSIHNSRFDEAMGTGADTMVVECVTCLESFAESVKPAGPKVVDIVSLVYERMNHR